MFGIITDKFIFDIYYNFKQLQYHPTSKVSLDEFEKCAINTLNHSRELIDAINVINLYQYCIKKWSKIERIFKKHLPRWREISIKIDPYIQTVSDDDSIGSFYITNGFNNRYKDIYLTSFSFNNEVYGIDYKFGHFSLSNISDYYIKFAKMSSVIMKLYNKNGEHLSNIVLSNNMGIFLEKNKTQYELIVYDDFIGVYEKKYIDNLANNDSIEADKLVASIEWDIINSKSELGLSKLEIYDENADLELLFYFATSTFLLFKNFRNAKRRNAFVFFMAIRNMRK